MRVVVVGNRTVNVLRAGLSGGGGELNERDQLRLLSEAGHEVLWYTNAGSEDLEIPGVRMFRLGSEPACSLSRGKRAATTRKRNLECRDLIRRHEPDFIVAQDCSNGGLARVLLQEDRPCLWHHHAPWDQSGFRPLMGILPIFRELSSRGSAIATVSEANRQNLRELLLSRKTGPFVELTEGLSENPDVFWNTVVYPYTLWHKPEISKERSGKIVAVGRLAGIKDAHVAFQALKGSPLLKDLVWYTISPKSVADQEYLDRVRKWVPEEALRFDQPHAEIMRAVSEARALLVMGSESFSITAAEANSYGTPVFIGKDTPNHAAREACVSHPKAVSQIGSYSSRKERLEMVRARLEEIEDLPYETRREIADAAWARYSPEASGGRLTGILEKAKDAYAGRSPKGGEEISLASLLG